MTRKPTTSIRNEIETSVSICIGGEVMESAGISTEDFVDDLEERIQSVVILAIKNMDESVRKVVWEIFNNVEYDCD